MENIRERYLKIFAIDKKNEELYHRLAAALGLSDSAFWILYGVYETKESITQNELAAAISYPKQTINSSVNTLIKREFIFLRQMSVARNSKSIHLTEKGRDFCDKNILPIIEAEARALTRMGEDSLCKFIELYSQQSGYIAEEIEEYIKILRRKKE